MFVAIGVILVVLFTIWVVRAFIAQPASPANSPSRGRWDYQNLNESLRNEQAPAMVVDLQELQGNALTLAGYATKNNKNLRLATKSIRVPDLIKAVLDLGRPFQGLMCYSVNEAEFLHSLYRFDNLLVAYPTVQIAELERACWMIANGATVYLMIDSIDHAKILSQVTAEFARRNNTGARVRLPVCIDLDVSWRPLGGLLHIGARRSPCRTLEEFKKVVGYVQQDANLRLAGVMAYEAQIAGLPDMNRFKWWLNPIVKRIKALSYQDVRQKRQAVAAWLEAQRIQLDFFNGGGTGSIHQAATEPWLSEVTAGSGVLQGTLFDMYESNRCNPAMAIALRVTRIPEPGVVCCQSGGFIASGSISPDKAPSVFLPEGAKTFDTEGFGEVQTPLALPRGLKVGLGELILIRPAKSGEIAERFNEYLCMRNGNVVERSKTYRGFGKAFF